MTLFKLVVLEEFAISTASEAIDWTEAWCEKNIGPHHEGQWQWVTPFSDFLILRIDAGDRATAFKLAYPGLIK